MRAWLRGRRLSVQRGQVRVQLQPQADPCGSPGLQLPGYRPDEVVQIQQVPLAGAPAGEGLEGLDQGTAAEAGLGDHLHVLAQGGALDRLPPMDGRQGEDGREHIVDVVGDPPGQQAQALHLLGLMQPGLELAFLPLPAEPVRDVLEDPDHFDRPPLLPHGEALGADLDAPPLGRDGGQLQVEGGAGLDAGLDGAPDDRPGLGGVVGQALLEVGRVPGLQIEHAEGLARPDLPHARDLEPAPPDLRQLPAEFQEVEGLGQGLLGLPPFPDVMGGGEEGGLALVAHQPVQHLHVHLGAVQPEQAGLGEPRFRRPIQGLLDPSPVRGAFPGGGPVEDGLADELGSVLGAEEPERRGIEPDEPAIPVEVERHGAHVEDRPESGLALPPLLLELFLRGVAPSLHADLQARA